MAVFIDKICIMIACSVHFFNSSESFMPVVAVLSTIVFSCLAQSALKKYIKIACIGLYCVLCFIDVNFLYTLPVIVYDILRARLYPFFALNIIAGIYFISDVEMWHFGLLLCEILLSVMLEIHCQSSENLRKKLIETRDNAVEYNNLLIEKNKQLIEKQDSEVHIATLKERNRIAREIHDNVGHLLTRTILQTGALQIINKDETLVEPLSSIKTTLDDAMNTIRQSVHNLYDDSIDLKGAVEDSARAMGEGYNVHIKYDCSQHISRKIKYCFIGIVKEALNNIVRHSNGDSVWITLREHPAMCTLSIIDNGVSNGIISSSGIGLENMEDRVKSVDGIINITSGADGFKIFVSVPKAEGENKNENSSN